MHRHRKTELSAKTYHGHWTMKLRLRTFGTYKSDMYTSIGIYISNIIDLPFICTEKHSLTKTNEQGYWTVKLRSRTNETNLTETEECISSLHQNQDMFTSLGVYIHYNINLLMHRY